MSLLLSIPPSCSLIPNSLSFLYCVLTFFPHFFPLLIIFFCFSLYYFLTLSALSAHSLPLFLSFEESLFLSYAIFCETTGCNDHKPTLLIEWVRHGKVVSGNILLAMERAKKSLTNGNRERERESMKKRESEWNDDENATRGR